MDNPKKTLVQFTIGLPYDMHGILQFDFDIYMRATKGASVKKTVRQPDKRDK